MTQNQNELDLPAKMISTGDFENAKNYLERLLDQNPENGWAYFYLLLAEMKLTDQKMLLKYPDIRTAAKFKLAEQYADEELKKILNEIIQKQDEVKLKAEAEQSKLAEEQETIKRIAEEERRRLEEEKSAVYRQKRKKQIKFGAYGGAVIAIIILICCIPTIIDHIRGCRIENGVLVEVLDKTLTEFVIPDGVTSIGAGAFSGCSNLSSVTIPKSVTSIGGSAFSGCSKLTITQYAKDKSVLPKDYNGALHIIIPKSVTSIGVHAFSGCSKLSSVTIPNSVTSIGDSAFSGCSNLSSVTIPNSVTSIGDSAFSRCDKLSSV
ncbi:MAG: leucine-rich repeat protein, partial [Lentisphaeria bacterium]|nr:leucine-rich repeat protein [Lentisphaeria bacterium]